MNNIPNIRMGIIFVSRDYFIFLFDVDPELFLCRDDRCICHSFVASHSIRLWRYSACFVGWNFSLTNCAEACGINANYLCSRFKNVYGVSFHSYVTKVRIDEAKRLLVESSMTVRKIGEKVGYLNLSHFIRVFRESEGCTPGIYRKK